MVESGKTTLSSQFVQLPETPTNFHRPSTSRSTKLAKSLNPSPQIPQRERIQYGYVNHVSRTFAYSNHQDFIPIPPLQVFSKISFSNSRQCQKIWSGFEIRALRHEFPSKYQISLKIRSPIRKIKIPQFSRFPRIPVSPSNSPQCHRIWSEFKLELESTRSF